MGDNASSMNTPASESTPPASTDALSTTPPQASAAASNSGVSEALSSVAESLNTDYVGSPLKKPRASVSTADENGLRKRLESNVSNNIGEVLGSAATSQNPDSTAGGTTSGGTASQFGSSLNSSSAPPVAQPPVQEEDEEL